MDFAKACILGLAITLPIIIGIQVERFEIGLAIALGALLSSPSDVSGSRRHTNYGITLSAILAVLASLSGGYLIADSWLGLPVLGLVMFGISYLSVFGFRASLISFSGLFALVLSFANISNVLEIYERALLIGVGGLWYLGLSYFWKRINPKAQTDQFLGEAFQLTAGYLQTRGDLLASKGDRDLLLRRLLKLQSDLNENHETLREILITSRKTSGNSNYERKRLLIFILLVDILEVAMANPVNYSKMDRLMQDHPKQIKAFQEVIFQMAKRLQVLSGTIHDLEKLPKPASFNAALKELRKSVNEYNSQCVQLADEGALMLQNLYNYQEKQAQNIEKIELLLANVDLREINLIKRNDIGKFITSQEYDLKLLLENFSIKSAIFKHSLRLAVVVMAGYAIGEYFAVQNAYWILLTIIVIMRPNYGLTKTRSRQRTVGTLIGAAIAIAIVFLSQDPILYAILSVISLVVAFSMVQKNYGTSAVFVTLSVVFVYALLEPNVLSVIQFRVLDTLIGAGLATVGNLILWPSWEFFGIKVVIADSIVANKEYLREVISFYQKKGKVPTSYKLARKKAFLGLGNLSTAFQRMTQEPKRMQKNLDRIYELTVLNHSFLSSLASMGTYIQNHATTEASSHFITFAGSIQKNLERCVAILENGEIPEEVEKIKQQEAEDFFVQNYYGLAQAAGGEGTGRKTISPTEELQEAQLVYEQLRWLLNLSVRIEKAIVETKFL